MYIYITVYIYIYVCVISKYLHSISGETPLSSRKEILGVMSAWNLHPTISPSIGNSGCDF